MPAPMLGAGVRLIVQEVTFRLGPERGDGNGPEEMSGWGWGCCR